MKIIADTNIILRFLVQDDVEQFEKAKNLFNKAEEIIVPTPVFCELAWVLSGSYKLKNDEISSHFKSILSTKKIKAREDEILAGLQMMDAGGDFSDGVNAYTGQMIATGSVIFASFDKKAVRLLTERGILALIPE